MASVPLHNLQRFIDAQGSIYSQVVEELRSGKKQSHWMWFIFPQIKGLGSSSTAQKYAIQNMAEAKAYLNHPLLGPRLIECLQLVNGVYGRSIEEIFGDPDHLKFHSSVTLFAQVSPTDPLLSETLKKFFRGKPDHKTLELI